MMQKNNPSAGAPGRGQIGMSHSTCATAPRKLQPMSRGLVGMVAPHSPAERRKQLLHAGYVPTPVGGKRGVLKAWQKKIETNDAEIDLWSELYPDAKSTGLLTRLMPALDLDILDQDAAEACEALARDGLKRRDIFSCALVSRRSARLYFAPTSRSNTLASAWSRRTATKVRKLK